MTAFLYLFRFLFCSWLLGRWYFKVIFWHPTAAVQFHCIAVSHFPWSKFETWSEISKQSPHLSRHRILSRCPFTIFAFQYYFSWCDVHICSLQYYRAWQQIESKVEGDEETGVIDLNFFSENRGTSYSIRTKSTPLKKCTEMILFFFRWFSVNRRAGHVLFLFLQSHSYVDITQKKFHFPRVTRHPKSQVLLLQVYTNMRKPTDANARISSWKKREKSSASILLM